ncbi:HEAT repeat domain-containing protein [Candidatus Palauibacter sp.]|uniref:HEAT repeat domain-containing protein n=1 Tax=Candidatus Palauibacter sp. TaxID=3101350 RepID=UPI003AF21B6C
MTEDACCGIPPGESAHAATIRRMIAAAPRFRPGATPAELVEEFTDPEHRMPAFLALYERGDEVLPHIRAGLRHPDWQVRRWCALFADNFADAETLRALVPLLRDPRSKVRLWAVHSLACEVCKDGPNPIDPIPLLLERIETDGSLRVRRQAVAMLAHHLAPDPRVTSVFRKILKEEEDRKLRLHAADGLKRYGAATGEARS